jgi:carbamoyltransferase
MNLLGLNTYHGDAAAALIVDGQVIAAAEEERFRRIKHWAGFPAEAIRWCLDSNNLVLADIDVIAINQDSRANLGRRLWYTLANRPSPKLIVEKLRARGQRSSIRDRFHEAFPGQRVQSEIINVEHHQAHLASAYYPSGFDDAWAISIDGFGDFASGAWGYGAGNNLDVQSRVLFPHSMGAFYQALTQYLGFPNYGDEYKVMGLAPYGKPKYLEALREVVDLRPDGSYRLDLSFFRHHRENVMFEWEGGSPSVGRMYSDKLIERFGPARGPGEELTQDHRDMAHSIQAMYEEAFFHLLNTLHSQQPTDNLVLAGGCGMNSVANGKVRRRSPFKHVYVQAAAGDAGGAVGAALSAWVRHAPDARPHPMRHAYLGPKFSVQDIEAQVAQHSEQLQGCEIKNYDSSESMCSDVAADISEGRVVGWFEGAMEWGPRALGHRSILGDPRREDMKDILNIKIKRRESFRPFAPSVLREAVGEWFEDDDDVPFMMKVFQIKEDKRALIPAVTHVDGSGRLQTVTEADNGSYYQLIKAFSKLTGVPMVLNTSFNENEPIVCRPEEAIDCFLRTKMDVLVLENTVIRRQ